MSLMCLATVSLKMEGVWEWAGETRAVEAELESYHTCMQAAAQPQRIALLDTRSLTARQCPPFVLRFVE